ncbi:MAG TPA: thiamine-phosphate kinase [Gemmatimonadaceae bacterium]|nr:thiamine-phosphate kinase [Gemmatimonadaceae bacterium]
MPHISLASGREFDLVRSMLARWGPLASGVGDDAAVLDIPPGERLVVSTDSSVDGVHFRREWLSPVEIGYRATTAALSDLAAMAAAPRGLVIALGLPDAWLASVEALADGIGEAARVTGTPIVGGDLTRATELSITVTVMGSTAIPTHRNAVRPGDVVYVTGVLGGPSAAVRAFERGEAPDPLARERFARPRARLQEGIWLAQHGVRAMIDISDGLVSELRHLAVASGVELRVDVDRIPVMRGCSWQDAIGGGEEYELVLASPHPLDVNEFARTFALPLSEIARARVSEHPGVVGGRPGTGERVDLSVGYDHFSA